MNTLSLFYMRHNRRTPMPPTPERPIHYYDLTIVLEGALEYHIDGTPITVAAGDALLIRQGMLRARDATTEKIDYIINIETWDNEKVYDRMGLEEQINNNVEIGEKG